MKTSDLKDLTIAIVGGGYGGAAAAKALSLIGATVDVYEQAPEIREVGAGIGLRPSTMERFRQWGIFDAIAQVSTASDYLEILTATGELIMREGWPGMDDYQVKTHTHLIHRGDFIDALISVLPDGIVHLGHKLDTIEDQGDRAKLTFANGETVTADLVIGADGIKSVVREQLFSTKPPVFAGEHAYRAVISADNVHGLTVDNNLHFYIGGIGGTTKVYFLPLPHRNQVSFDLSAPSTDSIWSPKVTKEDLLAAVEGFDERIVDIVRDLDMDDVNSRSAYDIDPIDTWHSDCVALLGDAAHSMLHHQGQGANSAIQDAAGLAEALSEAGSVKEALTLYQETRKPVTDELQRISRRGWNEDEVDDAFPGQHTATSPAQA